MNVVVVGGGNTGSRLAKILIDASHTVRVIEERPSILEKLGQEISQENIINGDGSSTNAGTNMIRPAGMTSNFEESTRSSWSSK